MASSWLQLPNYALTYSKYVKLGRKRKDLKGLAG